MKAGSDVLGDNGLVNDSKIIFLDRSRLTNKTRAPHKRDKLHNARSEAILAPALSLNKKLNYGMKYSEGLRLCNRVKSDCVSKQIY